MRKNIYNSFEEHKHFGRLADYIEIDNTYQNYKKGIKPKTETEQFAILHSGDIEWALNELERLNNIIKRLEEFIEKETEIYTLELTEKNTNALSYSLPIKAVYKEIYNVLQELKGSDK